MRRMVLALLLSSYLPSADASMVIDGTRIIFPAIKRGCGQGDQCGGGAVADPGLGRRWPRAKSTGKDSAPFIVLPPIVRIEPGKGQSWRLMFNGSRLPQDRESLFWFNLLDIPPEPKMARLIITCSSRYGRASSCFTVRQAWRRKNGRGKSPELGAGPRG